jgi:fumarylacetoacetate (FAA) hydrolase
MKLARIADNEPFYSVVIERAGEEGGAELFDFGVVVPNTLRPDMPLSHLEYLPVLMQMQERDGVLPRIQARLQNAPEDEYAAFRRPLHGETLLPPVEPPSFRDFYAFEQHVQNARRNRSLDMVPEWYDAPAFYFSNTAGIVGPDAPVRKPPESSELDYELEIAVIIGKSGRDIPIAEADTYIAGFTICNDWSLRDIQRQEMKVGLGPAKGKDFATSIGPYLVTPDELADRLLPDTSRGKRYDLTMTARVNGQEYSRGNLRDMHWTFAELIAHASRNTALRPGDLIGSGTVGTGCITEFPRGTYAWLQPGDHVRLEVERLGILENWITA